MLHWYTTGAYIRSLHHCYLYLRSYLVCTFFIYCDNSLSLCNPAYFCNIINASEVMDGKLDKGKFELNYEKKKLWTVTCFHVALYGHPWARGLMQEYTSQGLLATTPSSRWCWWRAPVGAWGRPRRAPSTGVAAAWCWPPGPWKG